MRRLNNDLMQKATNSDSLIERSSVNKKYGSADFDGWCKNIIENISIKNVLDVCCGTGNQLAIYSSLASVKQLVGVDVSKESLKVTEKRLHDITGEKEVYLKCISMEEMFKDPLIDSKFDLISCFYGLYYSQNVAATLKELQNHLSDEGHILIVGPYGNNNKALFDILNQHISLPELVVRSSSCFMESEVLPLLNSKGKTEIYTFENKIIYPSIEELMNYWKSSTFYSPVHEKAIFKDFAEVFNASGHFIVEKHIMAVLWRK